MGVPLLGLGLRAKGTPSSLLQRQICVITREGKPALNYICMGATESFPREGQGPPGPAVSPEGPSVNCKAHSSRSLKHISSGFDPFPNNKGRSCPQGTLCAGVPQCPSTTGWSTRGGATGIEWVGAGPAAQPGPSPVAAVLRGDPGPGQRIGRRTGRRAGVQRRLTSRPKPRRAGGAHTIPPHRPRGQLCSLSHMQARNRGGRAPRKLARAWELVGFFFDAVVPVSSSCDRRQAVHLLSGPGRWGRGHPPGRCEAGSVAPVLWELGAGPSSRRGPPGLRVRSTTSAAMRASGTEGELNECFGSF